MSTKVTINRLATGVPGLDEVLGGGLPEFSFNLIAGPPGCGKTTLAHQMMFALATPERPALFFYRPRRAAAEDVALSAAIRLFRQRSDQPVDPIRQPG
ncbi:ATPase domain-containing protein [Pseudomonas rossensis]|uniref:ATPase domain-containing protein n=1 Tax=Pseudomonas rossensis TaxID=2305471 RepID=UPI003260FF02